MNGHLGEFECQALAEFFALFSSPIRLRIFCVLRDGPKTVSELAEAAGVTLQNVSQHLRVMRDQGALRTTKQGQRVYCEVVDPRFFEAAGLIRDALSEQWRRRAAVISAEEESNDEADAT